MEVAGIAGVGVIAGVYGNENVSSPITGKGLIPLVFGLAVAGLFAFVVEMDGVSDFMIGSGIGIAASAVL